MMGMPHENGPAHGWCVGMGGGGGGVAGPCPAFRSPLNTSEPGAFPQRCRARNEYILPAIAGDIAAIAGKIQQLLGILQQLLGILQRLCIA
jgi:hypothetical protein